MTHKKGTSREPRPDVFRLKKRDGRCNRCLAQGLPLTWDHVPPKVCGNTRFVLVNRLFGDVLKTPPATSRSRNGTKYQTLCGPCNTFLGGFDEALGEFSSEIIAYASGTRDREAPFAPSIRPSAILRSVLGHLLAAKLDTDSVPIDSWIRDYLNGLPLDSRLKVYYWFFPYQLTVIARDFTFNDLSNFWNMDGLASVLKFLPLAFLVTDANVPLPFETLHQFSALAPSEAVAVPFNFEVSMTPYWPERPQRLHVVLGGAAFFDAMCSIDGHFPNTLDVQLLS